MADEGLYDQILEGLAFVAQDHGQLVGAGQDVRKRPVNTHIDFDAATGTQAERDLSLSTLLDMAITQDGQTLYATAFGSQKVGVFDTSQLANGTNSPSSDDQVDLSAGGPSGIVLDEVNNLAYVLTRFDNGLTIYSHNQLYGRWYTVRRPRNRAQGCRRRVSSASAPAPRAHAAVPDRVRASASSARAS